jgi:hypothetical protein
MKMMQDRASEQLRKVSEAHKRSIVRLEARREKLKLREKELKQRQALNESEMRELKNQKNLVEKVRLLFLETYGSKLSDERKKWWIQGLQCNNNTPAKRKRVSYRLPEEENVNNQFWFWFAGKDTTWQLHLNLLWLAI